MLKEITKAKPRYYITFDGRVVAGGFNSINEANAEQHRWNEDFADGKKAYKIKTKYIGGK